MAGSPPGPQRHRVPDPRRDPLAGSARAVWAVGDGRQAVRALADRRHLGPHRGHLGDPGRWGWELDWNAQIDAGVIRAHQHAAGARNGGSRRSRQATSRRWDGHGWADHQAPYHLPRPGPQPGHPPHSGPGRRHPAVDRVGGSGAGGAAWCPGRPRKRREHLTGDKAYSGRANRQALRARRIPHTILSGTTSRPTGPVGVLGVAGRRPLTGSATASATRSSG